LVGLVRRYGTAMSAIMHIRKVGTRRDIRLLAFVLRISEAVPELLWLEDKSLSPGKAQTEGREKEKKKREKERRKWKGGEGRDEGARARSDGEVGGGGKGGRRGGMGALERGVEKV